MPQVVRYPNFFAEYNALLKRVNRLEHAVNANYVNGTGQPTVNIGLLPYPWGPGPNAALYGFQTVNPNTQLPTATFGEVIDPTTQTVTTGLQFFAADGKTPLIAIRDTGMAVYDGTGTERAAFGLIGSEYGLATYQSGTAFMINAPVVAETTSNTSLSTTTLTQLAGTNSITFQVGPSGKFAVAIAAQVALPGDASANVGAYATLGYQIAGAGTLYTSRGALLQYSSGTSPEALLATVANQDLITVAANSTVTASLYGACSYAPPSGSCTIEGALAQVIAY